MKLTFEGAAGSVTGSLHILETGGKRYLLDCGMFQGRRKETEKRNCCFSFDPRSVDAVILSHAHIDHSGRLPLLVKQGFQGPIYATPATIDLCRAMLRDTAHILQSDVEFVNRHFRRGEVESPATPLFDMEDAEQALRMFRPVSYRTPTNLARDLTVEYFDAGHILGSASILLTNGATKLIFSGDVGRPGLPIIRDPEPLPPADYLILESTYGGRRHPPQSDATAKLESIVKSTLAHGGRLIVPAFAVGRTQQLVLLLHRLIDAERIPSVPIFVDSPLAVNVTEVFRAHPECLDEEVTAFLKSGEDPFGFRRLIYIRDAAESKKLNDLHGPFIVISPSGMCEAGRVLHHLRNNVGDPRNTVLLTGYQAENTLGRKLRDGLRDVRIFGIPTHVRASIQELDELSGHADSEELLAWMNSISPGLKKVFLVHGEPASAKPLADSIRNRYTAETVIASPDLFFEL